jgi:hypothetical protein
MRVKTPMTMSKPMAGHPVSDVNFRPSNESRSEPTDRSQTARERMFPFATTNGVCKIFPFGRFQQPWIARILDRHRGQKQVTQAEKRQLFPQTLPGREKAHGLQP